MNKIFKLTTVAVLVLCAMGCSKQDFPQDELGGVLTINLTIDATRGSATDSKTAINYDNTNHSLKSVWSRKDSIFVYSKKSGRQIGKLGQYGEITENAGSAGTSTRFRGEIKLESGDGGFGDDFAFVYQGKGRNIGIVNDSLLTYEIGTSVTVDSLNVWDIAYAVGKIQGTTENASCQLSFSNKLAFGYFSTKGIKGDIIVNNYFGGFTLNVKNGTITGDSAKFTIPADTTFYMPLIPGSTVNMSTKIWSDNKDKQLGYSYGNQLAGFTVQAGGYYRLGDAGNYGPVEFEQGDWTCYETLKNSLFNVGTVASPKWVHFTQGNLQYIGSAKDENGNAAPYWRMAETQYSYLGTANGVPSKTTTGSKIPADADVDLFGWGEATPPFLGSIAETGDYQPSITTADKLLPDTANWATKFNNKSATLYIEQGTPYRGIEGEKYIVLSETEWVNLFDNQYWCGATVTLNDGKTIVKGLVICPSKIGAVSIDENNAKEILGENIRKTSSYTPTALFSENTQITQQTIDDNGLLFLPAAGYRVGRSFKHISNGIGLYGDYWSITSYSNKSAYGLEFQADNNQLFAPNNHSYRYYGASVRLATVEN